jgi:hypothetical protein
MSFQTFDELHHALQTAEADGLFDAKFHSGNYTTMKGVCNRFIDGSTLRGLHGVTPKERLTTWVRDNFSVVNNGANNLVNQLQNVENAYHAWHNGVVTNLQEYWQLGQAEMQIGHARKIVDLLLKQLINYRNLDEQRRTFLKNHAHIALDSKVLRSLRILLNNEFQFNIPANATMGLMNRNLFADEYYGIQTFLSAQIPHNSLIQLDYLIMDLADSYEPPIAP